MNGAVRKKLGVKRASFADAETTREITGMDIGGVTVVGLPDDLPVWVDSRVMERERIILGGGSRSCKVLGATCVAARAAERRGGGRAEPVKKLADYGNDDHPPDDPERAQLAWASGRARRLRRVR